MIDEFIVSAVEAIKENPTYDVIEAEAAKIAENVPSSLGLPNSLTIKSQLLHAAVEAGKDKDTTEKIIESGMKKGAAAAAKNAEKKHITDSNAWAVAEIEKNPTEETVRNVVYKLVKSEGFMNRSIMQPVQLNRDAIVAAFHGEADEKTISQAIEDGITAARGHLFSTSFKEDENFADIVKAVSGEKGIYNESRYLAADKFESIMNAAIMAKDGRVILTGEAEQRAVDKEKEALRRNPTLEQLKLSTLKLSRGGAVCLDSFEELAATMGKPQPSTQSLLKKKHHQPVPDSGAPEERPTVEKTESKNALEKGKPKRTADGGIILEPGRPARHQVPNVS